MGNSGYGNSGVFCTQENKILIFDEPSNLTLREWYNSEWCPLFENFLLCEWINETDMTDQEKADHKEFYTTGGYLKKYEYKEAWSNLWNKLTTDQKEKVKTIPNFNADKFFEITGIKIEKE